MKPIIAMVIRSRGERELVIAYNIAVNIKKINVFVHVRRYLVPKSTLQTDNT